MSSGEEESLILAEKQESQATPSHAPGVPTLASSPALEAEEVLVPILNLHRVDTAWQGTLN